MPANPLRVQLMRLHEAATEARIAIRNVNVDLLRLAGTKPPGAERARLRLDARRLAEIEQRLAAAAAVLAWTLRFLPTLAPR